MYHHFLNAWNLVLKENRNLQAQKYSHFWHRNGKCLKLFSRNKWAVTDHDEDVSSVLFLTYKKVIKMLCIFSITHRFFLFFFSLLLFFCFSPSYPFMSLLRIILRPLKEFFLNLCNFLLNQKRLFLLFFSVSFLVFNIQCFYFVLSLSLFPSHTGTTLFPHVFLIPFFFPTDTLRDESYLLSKYVWWIVWEGVQVTVISELP